MYNLHIAAPFMWGSLRRTQIIIVVVYGHYISLYLPNGWIVLCLIRSNGSRRNYTPQISSNLIQ